VPLPVIDEVARVAFNWSAGSQHAVNVMHFSTGGATASAVADALEANVTSDMWAIIYSGATIASLDVTILDSEAATHHHDTSGPPQWGGGVGGQHVPQVAAIIKLTTPVRGRSSRGRVFLPFIAEASIENGLITSVDAGTMQDGWTAFRNAMDADGFGLVVASYKLEVATDVSACTLELQTGTQRRRQTRNRV